VRLSLATEYLMRIPQDSQARHAREAGMIGASVIDIVPRQAERAIAEGARINFEPRAASRRSSTTSAARRFRLQRGQGRHVADRPFRRGRDADARQPQHEVEQLPATHRAIRKLAEKRRKPPPS